jgi:hypothetical protein
MELKGGPCCPSSHGNIFQDPTLADPVCHQRCNRQRGRDWSAFKIFALSRIIFGYIRNSDIEACKASEATKNKEREEEVVGWSAKANGECCCGGRETKRHLFDILVGLLPSVAGEMVYQICQGIKLLPHQTALLPPSCNLAIHEIEE